MEYTIGFKINESIKSYTLHTLVLTPDKKIGIIDYEPNRNTDKIKVRMSINVEGEYNTYDKSSLTVVIPFILDSECKEYSIKSIDNYHIFKNKNERFKDNEIEIENDIVLYLTNNKNYENPTLSNVFYF